MINDTKTTIISVEGLDCSFKETNVAALKKQLENDGYSVVSFDFPQYKKDSSYFVRQFLNNPDYRDPNPLTMEQCCKYCMYYAFDRYDTYINDIKQYMGNVDIILFDRFVNSNLFNAARMMPNVDKVLDVVEWLYKFEYELLKLPQEDISIFLRMPYEKARIIRQAKAGKDLNEVDEELSKNVYSTYDLIYSRTNKDISNKNMKRISNLDGPHNYISINIGLDEIDFVKTLTDEAEREKSKELIFTKIMDESYIFIEACVQRRKNYGKENS